MALSNFTTILLLGIVGLNSSALAQGTKAGTEVVVKPTIEYKMDGAKVKEKVVKAKYVVDKVIQFKVTRVLGAEQKTVKGLTFLAPFKVLNSGNSIENFVLNFSYGADKQFSFDKTVIYIDKNRDGKLEASEEVDASVLKRLSPDKSQLVWLGAVTPKSVALNTKVRFGLQAKASGGGKDTVYKKATTYNVVEKEDIVFGDDDSENDAFFNNSYINRYLWSIQTDIDLGMKLSTNIMSADPLNGIAKDKKDAEAGKYFSIPGATHVRSWRIYNDSVVIAKDIHFSIDADSEVERFAKSSKNTWWKSDRRIHILRSSENKIIGEGEYNSRRNSVDFTIKELKGGESVYPHVVTVIK